jgi:WD40 repeat protein/biotin carboxyl carrier protein
MFRWAAVTVLFFGLGVVVLNAINKSTSQKAVATDEYVFSSSTEDLVAQVGENKTNLVDGNPGNNQPKVDGPATVTVSRAGVNQPLVIANARISAMERQEIPAEKDGKLLFVGTDIKPNRDIHPDDVFKLTISRLVIEDEKVSGSDVILLDNKSNKKYRLWKGGEDQLTPGKLALDYKETTFYKLEVGDEVQKNQMVALVNPVLALDDLGIRAAKLEASEADRRASEKTRDEAHKRFQQQSLLRQKGAGSDEEYRSAELFWRRYIDEESGKAALVVQSQRELNAAVTTLKMHEIRSSIPGVIKTIYRNRGEAIKNLEPLLQVQNRDRLRVEGLVEVQDARTIGRNTKVIVEPSQPEQPKLVLRGHLQEVTAIGVCHQDGVSTIISGSEDSSIRAWNPGNSEQLWALTLKHPVKSLACYSGKSSHVVGGLSDGSLVFFSPATIREKDAIKSSVSGHRGIVHAVAISPDGEYAVSAGEDHSLCVWKIASAELLQKFTDAHRSGITSVAFAGAGQIASAGKDNSIRVWAFDAGKIDPSMLLSFDKRSGDVSHLGASPDGKTILFDQGKEIRVLSLADKHLLGIITCNSGGSSSFTNFAVYSPDGKTVLTNGGSDGKVQLWRTPINNARPAELRQYIWTGGSSSCCAFCPDGSFAVTGTQDHQVLVWALPNKREVEETLFGNIALNENFLDSNSRQVRIWVDLKNPGWLHPGGTATLVIPGAKVSVTPDK